MVQWNTGTKKFHHEPKPTYTSPSAAYQQDVRQAWKVRTKTNIMKHLLFILTATIFIGIQSFAAGHPDTDPVSSSFQKQFRNAEEVQWSRVDDYFKASFLFEGQYVTAFYEGNGHLVALTRNISTTQLPLGLGLSLKKNFQEFWVTELFECTWEEGTVYYLTLENGKESILMRSAGHSEWTRVKKTMK
jgi:hypothetical protein